MQDTVPTALRTALLYDYGRRVDARNTDGLQVASVYALSPVVDARWVGRRGQSQYRVNLGDRKRALGWLVVALAELGYEKLSVAPKE